VPSRRALTSNRPQTTLSRSAATPGPPSRSMYVRARACLLDTRARSERKNAACLFVCLLVFRASAATSRTTTATPAPLTAARLPVRPRPAMAASRSPTMLASS